ncbi:MAG: hypothetical protein FJX35_28365, partial [Alphaproteobacteria bacterium]|nr:hypothetical protein [Alphaproteobacteria bacterium]
MRASSAGPDRAARRRGRKGGRVEKIGKNGGARRSGAGRGGSAAHEPVRPQRADAEEAVRTLLRWAGDDPSREGLRDTPGRVTRAF